MASRNISANEEIRILLIGSPAAGKSATGNAIAGTKVFKEYAVVDRNNRQTNVRSMDRFGCKIRIVDTPGTLFIEDPSKIPPNEWEEFRANVAPGPHAIVLVISAGNRFPPAEVNSLSRLRETFPDEFDKFCVIVFTKTEMWEEQGYTVKTFFDTLPVKVQDLLIPCMANKRALAFQNCFKQEEKAKELLDILKEMKTANNDQYIDSESLMQPQSINRPLPVPPGGSTRHSHQKHSAQDPRIIFAKKLERHRELTAELRRDLNRMFIETLQEAGSMDKSQELQGGNKSSCRFM